MTAKLMDLIETGGFNDWLGEIFMELSLGNKNSAQFFTPYTMCRMCAEAAMDGVDLTKPKLRMSEPSSGGGAMIIAAAEALKKRGINYQKRLYVVAQDLDIKTVYMCYVQLSFYGIRADCVAGNTLTEPYNGRKYPPERIFRTPARMGLLDFAGWDGAGEACSESEIEVAARADEPPCIAQQDEKSKEKDAQEVNNAIEIDINGQKYQTMTLF